MQGNHTLFNELQQISARPKPFEFYTASDLWTNEYTSEQMLKFHLDEAMSWESVRNLRQMNRSFLLVRNLIQQGGAPERVTECLESVDELMAETMEALDDDGAVCAFGT